MWEIRYEFGFDPRIHKFTTSLFRSRKYFRLEMKIVSKGLSSHLAAKTFSVCINNEMKHAKAKEEANTGLRNM